jgi:hypothetical protein
VLLGVAGAAAGTTPRAHAASAEPDDEIHVDYGNDASSSMWVHWRGPDSTLGYGLTTDYGSTATASPTWVTPVDIAGPFWEVELTGLQPGTIYHYAIGPSGLDHTFETAPTGNFRWDDIGDTGTTYYDPTAGTACNKSWMAEVWNQIAADQPDMVTHGGDIDYANECGQPSVHQFFEDVEPIAEQRPIEFAWGKPRVRLAIGNCTCRVSARHPRQLQGPDQYPQPADRAERHGDPDLPSRLRPGRPEDQRLPGTGLGLVPGRARPVHHRPGAMAGRVRRMACDIRSTHRLCRRPVRSTPTGSV